MDAEDPASARPGTTATATKERKGPTSSGSVSRTQRWRGGNGGKETGASRQRPPLTHPTHADSKSWGPRYRHHMARPSPCRTKPSDPQSSPCQAIDPNQLPGRHAPYRGTGFDGIPPSSSLQPLPGPHHAAAGPRADVELGDRSQALSHHALGLVVHCGTRPHALRHRSVQASSSVGPCHPPQPDLPQHTFPSRISLAPKGAPEGNRNAWRGSLAAVSATPPQHLTRHALVTFPATTRRLA